ncbi:MAG: hypothetical protein M3315_04015 [Actinomycetota bacterium]|jgi:hypothetical protein|nr:hypothetical protein [Actinomycetota bacterium]
MVWAILIVKNPDSTRWEPMGTHEFTVLPRVGEHISLDINGDGYLYGVVGVHHPGEPADGGVDIYAVLLAMVSDEVLRLFRESVTAR